MATAASRIAPPPIRKQVPVIVEIREFVLKKRKPQRSQMGDEKLLTVRQLGHCLMEKPLHGSAIRPPNGLEIRNSCRCCPHRRIPLTSIISLYLAYWNCKQY